jgi:polyhydroxyalkanoate synthesis repressor PhaR
MRTIKRYANRRLYDTQDKRYVTMDRIRLLLRRGEEFRILESRTGEDITSSVTERFRTDPEKTGLDAEAAERLSAFLRTGSEALAGLSRLAATAGKITAEADAGWPGNLISRLATARGVSPRSGRQLKEEVEEQIASLKDWAGELFETRLDGILSRMNLPTTEQYKEIYDRIAFLEKKVMDLERKTSVKRPGARKRK